MKPNMKIFDDMKKIFICIALIAISSCTIKDYEKDGYSFNNYMRNVALRYILDAADALEYMISADEIINGGGSYLPQGRFLGETLFQNDHEL